MSDYTELKRLAEEQCISSDLGMFEDHQLCENILALIGDLDEARNGMKHSCAIRLKKQIEQLETERDQLKAENEALRKECDRLAEDNRGLLEDFEGAL